MGRRPCGTSQCGKHRPHYYYVLSPLCPLGCWFVCLFLSRVPPPTRRPQVLPLVRAEQEQKACHRAVFAFEGCQRVLLLHHRCAGSEVCGSG